MGLLKLKSEEQIFGDAFARIQSELGINDANPGSVLSTLLEAMAAEDFEQYLQMVQIIRNFNLDTTTGTDLDNRAAEFGLTRDLAKKATGLITIERASTFTKVSTTFYAGRPAAVAGNTTIYVNDASSVLFGTSGTLVIGRGTANEEQVTYSVAPVNNTNYWTITISPLSNNHGLDETVVLAQGGDITISAGTLVVVPATGTSAEIDFSIDQDTLLPTGEADIDNVSVTCTEAGSQGNIPVNAITGSTAFPTPPFSGARAVNEAAYTTGQDRESDEALRGRIKNTIQSLSRGIKSAILNGIIGLVDPATAKRVVSAAIVLPVSTDENVKIYIDDGTGFEPSFDSQGFETVLDPARGGETRLQLQHLPVVKAQVETNVAEPYNMSAGSLTLIYVVGGTSETVTFSTSDFLFPGSVTAQEIVTLINERATLIQARTSESGEKLVITAVSDTNETLQVTGGTANSILNFPTDERSTLYLYVNDRLLSKDGSTAAALSVAGTFNFTALGGVSWPLNIIVDGKSANPQVVTLVSGDFSVPASATPAEVITAINARLAGATASLDSTGTKVKISSNQPFSSAGQIQITGGSANTALGFSTANVVGVNKQYTLNRFLGQIELVDALEADDSVTAGSLYTRAYLRTTSAESYVITAAQTLVLTIDGVDQTVTFANNGTYTAAQVAALINAAIVGGFARTREIGGLTYLEVSTSSQAQGTGSIKVKSTSTAVALNFTYDTTISNQRPQAAFQVSGNAGAYVLLLNTSLIIVIDNAPAVKTYTVPMSFAGTLTSASSTTVFAASAFNTVFTADDDIKNFWLVMTSGGNYTTGTVSTVSNTGGNTWRYVFSALPTNLNRFASGDHVTFSSMQNAANNGPFIVTAVNTAGNGYIEVTNATGVAESGSTGGMAVGARRQISAYTALMGAITLGSALPVTPAIADTFGVLPSTVANVLKHMNNTRITPISAAANIDASDHGTKVQISSLSNGSDGYVQVTGGSANTVFAFSTTAYRGLQGYQYFTNLLALVNKTIYGDDSDPVSFPGIGAGGIQFDIQAPTVQSITFSLDLTLDQGFSLTGLSDQIKSAITQYVNGLGVGDSVILSEVIAAVMAVAGVADVEIITPTSNVLSAENQLARCKSSDITLG
jgi:uncharacterized phage protein gp47/JayE